MAEENSIQVNFGKPMPLFPLDTVTLLPQQLLPLHIFEDRYKQMVKHALDGAGQIAMAVYAPAATGASKAKRPNPRLRPAVCVGQIMQHEPLEEGRYNLLVQGICRARILKELPAEQGRDYRLAFVEPVGLDPGTLIISRGDDDDDSADAEEPTTFEAPSLEPAPLTEVRARICDMLSEGPLTHMVAAEPVLEFVKNEDVPTGPLLELVSFMLITDQGLRYRLLAEPSLQERAGLIMQELEQLATLIRRATTQHAEEWPKGLSWN